MKFINLSIIFLLLVLTASAQVQKPNIIILYADDLGYGDVSCYGASRIKTENVDQLAKEGLRFTDAHSTASTCTPSRFSLLTGIYAFRNKAKILPGDAPLLIDPSIATLPKAMKANGYITAAIGKWHLGMGIGKIDWNTKIIPGANEIGFDYSYLLPATADRVPTVFVENGSVQNLEPNDPIEVSYTHKVGNEPTGTENPELLRIKADPEHSNTIVNGIGRIGFMSGGKKARWADENMADSFTTRAIRFIRENRDHPFFLYFPFNDIHVPRAPNQRFVNKSSMGSRGDVILQMDWVVGRIMSTLRELQLDNNTLVIFTSDNGPVLDDGYADQAEELAGDHKPGGPYRGGKYSMFEAGTRMPFITWWPGKIKPGQSDAMISQVDLFASLVSLTGGKPGPDVHDSRDLKDVLLGENKRGRKQLLEEGYVLALREGKFKYIEPLKAPTNYMSQKRIEMGLSLQPQLYNINSDPGERKNLADKYPRQVKKWLKNSILSAR